MQKLVLQATCWQTLELEGRSGNKVRSDKSTWSKQCMKWKANSIVCWLGWHDGCWGVYRVQFSRPIKLPPCVVILGFVAWWSSILLYENGHVAISPCSQVSFSTIDSILCVCVCIPIVMLPWPATSPCMPWRWDYRPHGTNLMRNCYMLSERHSNLSLHYSLKHDTHLCINNLCYTLSARSVHVSMYVCSYLLCSSVIDEFVLW